MHLKKLELHGFKSFAKKSEFIFDVPIVSIVGPNGSGKSNVVESIRFVLGEQSVKSMRGKTGSDLIFKGSKDIPKKSRASVTIVFDNADRVFHLHHHNNQKISVDFDEIAITREVYADGANKYFINGHEVRMKDVHELIASVNIGASGHHIISQGEADRYLNANPKDRRILIEEALGLKVYQYRLKESKRKLEKSQANMRESEMLRRELAPHLRFLKRQVDKIEKAKHLREELRLKYSEFLSREEYLLNLLGSKILEKKTSLLDEISLVEEGLQAHAPQENKRYAEEDLLLQNKKSLESLRRSEQELFAESSRIEGMISLLEKQQEKKPETQNKLVQKVFAYKKVHSFINSLISLINGAHIENIAQSKDVLNQIKKSLSEFISEKTESTEIPHIDNSSEIAKLKVELEPLALKLSNIQHDQKSEHEKIAELELELQKKRLFDQEAQKKYYELLAKDKELRGSLRLLEAQESQLGDRKQKYVEELTEAKVLLGESEIVLQKVLLEHVADLNVTSQETLRRELERMKIRLEDMGGGSGVELIKEFDETKERDEFLEKEINDLSQTILSLEDLIADLQKKLNSEFDAGVIKINKQFNTFFKLMFGGGQASLEKTLIKKRISKKAQEEIQTELFPEEEQEKEYGVDIKVQLPRKKVSALEMLSGGERSLTSIALLFALSQVNPPPFLVLDETDAALDEANSQKYGNMIESLSEYSQLIVVTHNRETMSRAHTLFGVTLGADDSSTLLSLRLEDANKYAK